MKKSFEKVNVHKCNTHGRDVGAWACPGKLPSEARGPVSQIWKLLWERQVPEMARSPGRKGIYWW